MKRFMSVFLLVLLLTCVAGCSKKDKLVGVYQRGDNATASNTIILYKDGSCNYLGTDNATWRCKGDTVTVTTYEPDGYYLDVCFDTAIADHQFASMQYYVMFVCVEFEAVSDSKVESINESHTVRIVTKEILKETDYPELYTALRAIEGVQKVEACLEKGNSWDYELTVVDNCLVADSYPMDAIYVKKGS